MRVLITYEGYALYEYGRSYKSEIDGRSMEFDSAGQFIQYINKITGKEK